MAKKKTAKKKTKKAKRKTTASKKKKTRKKSLTLAIVALVLNAVIYPLPGIGSLVGGKVRAGIWQLALGIIGDLLFVFWIGIPIWLVAWVWGVITGAKLIQEAQ